MTPGFSLIPTAVTTSFTPPLRAPLRHTIKLRTVDTP